MDQSTFRLKDIFSPHEAWRRSKLLSEGRKLVHYTSADNAIKILRSSNIWMRNVRVMNDFMEVDHGISMINRSLYAPVETPTEEGIRAVVAALNELFPGLGDEVIQMFQQWYWTIRNRTHVTCLSEHDPHTENEHGRLSMWRSYSANHVGVALVINPLPFYALNDGLGAFSSPVFYFDDSQLKSMLIQIVTNIRANRELLAVTNPVLIKGQLFLLLRSIAHCTKHPGFAEEQEWRIMHTNGLDNAGSLFMEVDTVSGVPQPVIKLPLKNDVSKGVTGISIPEILERVIVGPTQFPEVISDALASEMAKAGISDFNTKLTRSTIPLRT